jgi:hypothetical protein
VALLVHERVAVHVAVGTTGGERPAGGRLAVLTARKPACPRSFLAQGPWELLGSLGPMTRVIYNEL